MAVFRLFVVVAISLALLHIAHADVRRDGFTLHLGAGVGYFSSFEKDGGNVGELAWQPFSVGIGGFVAPRVALFARASAGLFQYSPSGTGQAYSRLDTTTTRMVFLGASAQSWLGESLSLELGLGVTTLGNGPVEGRLNRGLGIPVRVAWSLFDSHKGALSATAEWLPSIFAKREITSTSTFGLQWQWY